MSTTDTAHWIKVGQQSDLVANSGVCALVNGAQVALFYLPALEPQVYAVGNWDPVGKANVLSRGMVGDLQGQPVVASPLYKQHYNLQTGQCLEKAEYSVPVYAVKLEQEAVWVQVTA